MASGMYILSDNGKYALELLTYTPPIDNPEDIKHRHLGHSVTQTNPSISERRVYTRAEIMDMVYALGGTTLNFYQPVVGDTIGIDGFGDVDVGSVTKNTDGEVKAYIVRAEDTDHGRDDSVGIDGTMNDYHYWEGNWVKVKTKAEDTQEKQALIDASLVPVAESLAQLRSDFDEDMAAAMQTISSVNGRVNDNGILISALNSRADSTASLIASVNNTLGARITALESPSPPPEEPPVGEP